MFASLDCWFEEPQTAGDKCEEALPALCKIQPKFLQKEYCICGGHKIFTHLDPHPPRVLHVLHGLDASLAMSTKIKGIQQTQQHLLS